MYASRAFRKTKLLKTVLLLSTTGCTFFMAQYLSKFLESVSARSEENCGQYLAGIAIILVLQMIIDIIKKRYYSSLCSRQTNLFECSIYLEYLARPVRGANESDLSVICEKDIPTVASYHTDVIPQTIQAIIGIGVYSAFMLLEDNGFALLILLIVLSLFQYLPPVITEKYLIKNYIRAGEEEAMVQQQILSGLEGIHTIKMLGLENWFMDQFQGKQQAFRKTGERAAATASFQSAMGSGISLLQQVGVLLIGFVGVTYGWFSLGTLITGYVLSTSFYQYAACLGRFKASRGMYRAALQRIEKLYSTPEAKPVQLHYQMKLELPYDGCWLVKGENGSGKTTLLSILCAQRPSNECITRNGNELDARMRKDITSWCPQMYLGLTDSFQTLVDMVPEDLLDRCSLQEYLNHFSVAEELLDKPLNRLSGGEQKKLILALTMARKSQILLLDEPEVSLDQASVAVLSQLLQKDPRLILLVTHNPLFDSIATGSITVQGGEISVEA